MPFRTLALIGAIGALLVVSCASDGGSAATVNGVVIAEGDVLALRHSFDDSTVDGEAFRQDLTPLIFLEAQLQTAEVEFGLTGLDGDERLANKRANMTEEETRVFDSVTSDPDRTAAIEPVLLTQFVVREEVTKALFGDPAAAAELLASTPEQVSQVCARHILLPTESEAAAARERVLAGEDFATVASEVSLDTQSPGGALPCPSNAAAYVEPFGFIVATQPLGELSAPFLTQFGWHIAIVDERVAPSSPEDITADPFAYVDPILIADRFSIWVDAAVASSEIDVASQVGTWFPEADGILPPS